MFSKLHWNVLGHTLVARLGGDNDIATANEFPTPVPLRGNCPSRGAVWPTSNDREAERLHARRRAPVAAPLHHDVVGDFDRCLDDVARATAAADQPLLDVAQAGRRRTPGRSMAYPLRGNQNKIRQNPAGHLSTEGAATARLGR